MAKFFDAISDDHAAFIRRQHLFFVATSPLSADGHVNLSPKGMDSFRVLGPNQVAYLDMTGSGNETSAHLRENGRVTFMFCAFDGPPNIMRLYGEGRTVLPGDADWDALAAHFTLLPGTRQIITADIHKVQTSCGYAVPQFDFREDRQQLVKWAEHKGEDGLADYRRQKNACSIDDLPTPLGDALNHPSAAQERGG
jgi:hypothetical protein